MQRAQPHLRADDLRQENIDSAKSIVNNGGVLENAVFVDGEVIQHYWIGLGKME